MDIGDESLFGQEEEEVLYAEEINEDDLESYEEYMEFFQINDENEDGEPIELNFD